MHLVVPPPQRSRRKWVDDAGCGRAQAEARRSGASAKSARCDFVGRSILGFSTAALSRFAIPPPVGGVPPDARLLWPRVQYSSASVEDSRTFAPPSLMISTVKRPPCWPDSSRRTIATIGPMKTTRLLSLGFDVSLRSGKRLRADSPIASALGPDQTLVLLTEAASSRGRP